MSSKAEANIRLAMLMQGTSEGISLQDIMTEFGVSRRTAERMRDNVGYIFPQMREAFSDGRIKRWRIPSGTLNSFATFSFDDVLTIENAIKNALNEGYADQATNLKHLLEKVRLFQSDADKRKNEPDLEALMEAEGFAFRPGPRPLLNHDFIESIRHAIKANTKLEIGYLSRGYGKKSKQKICPYGLIYGKQNYLVGYNLNPKVKDYRLYSIPNILSIKVLDEIFTKDDKFSLQEYMLNSFGVYQEEPFDVVWKFSKEVAEEAKSWMFHPSQTMEIQEDGSLLVKFTAGGKLEMDWHLYTWADQVEDLTNYDD